MGKLMIGSKSFIFRFADVEVSEREFSLIKAGEVLAVEPKAFRVLLILLQNPRKVITKDELLEAVWGDIAVSENSLARSIALLRRLLGDDTRNPRYIETVATVGYRFLCEVEVSGNALETPDTTSGPDHEHPAQSPGAAGEGLASAVAIGPVSSKKKVSRILLAAMAAIPLLIMTYFAVRYFTQPRVPAIANIVRLTNDRMAKIPINGVVTDGLHLYFMEAMPSESSRGIAQVAAIGGETTWIQTTLKEALAIPDISPDKSKLLLVAGGGGIDSNEFWVQPLPAGTPRRVGSFKAFTADWTPDGSHIIYSYQHKIAIVNEDGSDPDTIAEVPGSAAWFRYSPDGRLIRFSILKDLESSSSLWEMRADGTNLHQLLPNWKESLDQCCGRWSPDGNYYYFLTSAFFAGGGGPSQGIWVMPEHRSIFRGDSEPVRLTTGPLRFGAPTPSTDGKSLFAVGDELRVELLSYDPHAQRFDSYLGGLSAGPVAFSPDGKWVAYVSYPEMTLWKSRTDLSEKMQLTFPPVRVYGPQWSPDGSQIAFGNVQFHRPPKVYLVSASGGDSPKQIAPSNIGDADTDPTWTPDGKSIIFARAPAGERGVQAVYRVDLSSGNPTLIPGSNSLYSPRISPDGRYIAALTADARQLKLLDQTTNSWSTLAEGEHFGFNDWSPEGKYVYALENGRGFGKIVRVRIKDRVLEDILSLKNFPQLVDPFAEWYGLTPDGKLLLMRDRSVQEIYALDLAKN
jgi:Tol biopolymer transport system component/DNA-binding winged helix-turn-helix (wHTH) protein